jgi:hypothetical protein
MASTTDYSVRTNPGDALQEQRLPEGMVDAYFSADVETDGPIPGPFSILSFAILYAGRFDGRRFERPKKYDKAIYKELKPISDQFQEEALHVNRLDRRRLSLEGESPEKAMTEACRWILKIAEKGNPVLVAYPLSFDWTWLYWYFVRFSAEGSPFEHSRCFDIKTALAVKARISNFRSRPIAAPSIASLKTSAHSPRFRRCDRTSRNFRQHFRMEG